MATSTKSGVWFGSIAKLAEKIVPIASELVVGHSFQICDMHCNSRSALDSQGLLFSKADTLPDQHTTEIIKRREMRSQMGVFISISECRQCRRPVPGWDFQDFATFLRPNVPNTLWNLELSFCRLLVMRKRKSPSQFETAALDFTNLENRTAIPA